MQLTIETATTKILDELYAIEKQSFTREAFSKREIAFMLEDYNSIGLVARVNRIDIERGRLFGHILTLDVAPRYRHMGVARKLLEELDNLLKQKGAVECRLEVREDNVAAINLYLKLGYQRLGMLKNYYGNAHGLYLRKTLSPPE